MGLVSCCSLVLHAKLEGHRVSLLLHSRLGGEHLLTGQGLWQQFVPEGCWARFRHQQEWPDLPLQQQQPTQGNGLAARQGCPPSPVTDRQTDRSPSAVGSHCPCPPPLVQGSVPSPAVGACPWGAVPFLPCPGSMSSGGSAGVGLVPAHELRAFHAVAGAADPRAHPARRGQGCRTRGSVAAGGQGAGLVFVLLSFATSGSREINIFPDTPVAAKMCQAL